MLNEKLVKDVLNAKESDKEVETLLYLSSLDKWKQWNEQKIKWIELNYYPYEDPLRNFVKSIMRIYNEKGLLLG